MVIFKLIVNILRFLYLSFTLFGFPVRVSPLFLVSSIILGYSLGFNWILVGWVIIMFISILIHELGHAFTMRKFGYTPSIELHWFGGSCAWGDGPEELRPLHRGLVSFAGPLVGLITGGIILSIAYVVKLNPGSIPAKFVFLSIFTTIVWSIFNLIPMFPLDGGDIVLAIWNGVFPKKSNSPIYIFSIIVSLVIFIVALKMELQMLASVAMLCAWITRAVMTLENKPPILLDKDLASFSNIINENNQVVVIEDAKKLLKKSMSQKTRQLIIEALCWAYIGLDKEYESESWFAKIPPGGETNLILKGVLLLNGKKYEEAAHILELAYLEEPLKSRLYLAECYIQLSNFEQSLAILNEGSDEFKEGELEQLVDLLIEKDALYYAEKLSTLV
jgi:Zn-dependent protease